MRNVIKGLLLGVVVLSGSVPTSLGQTKDSPQTTLVRAAYKGLIDAENAHDLSAVARFVLDSPDTLFVAKAPVGWKGYWGKGDVMQHLHDMYQQPFRIDPDYGQEKGCVSRTRNSGKPMFQSKSLPSMGALRSQARSIMVLLWVSQNKYLEDGNRHSDSHTSECEHAIAEQMTQRCFN